MSADRSVVFSVVLGLLSAVSLSHAQERPASPFNRTILVGRAEELAKQAYVEPQKAPDPPQRLTYDQYRAIRFTKGSSIWRGENRTFTVDLFYPGFIYETPVNINLVVGGMGRRVLFKSDL